MISIATSIWRGGLTWAAAGNFGDQLSFIADGRPQGTIDWLTGSARAIRTFCASARNRLDVSAYRCVDVAGRNRQNCSASIFPVMAGCHPARATDNVERSKRFRNFLRGRVVGLSQEISVHKDGKQIVETAVEARGGLLGRPLLLVLIVSCVLAVFALIVTYSGA